MEQAEEFLAVCSIIVLLTSVKCLSKQELGSTLEDLGIAFQISK